MHHFLEYLLFARLCVRLVLLTDHILTRIVPQLEEIGLGVKTIVRHWLVRVAIRVLERLVGRHDVESWRHTTLPLHNRGLTTLVTLVSIIVIEEGHMLRKLSIHSLSIPSLGVIPSVILDI